MIAKSSRLLIVFSFLLLISCDESNEPAPFQGNEIIFSHSFGDEEFGLAQTTHLNQAGNTLQISQLKYFVSNVEFVDENRVSELASSNNFIDLSEDQISTTFSSPSFNKIKSIRFLIGVDSSANYSDPASHPASSVLNPSSNDMYWNWMSGYIFISMEGFLKDQVGTTIGGFSYHVGKSENLMEIELETNIDLEINNQININFDLKKLFNSPNIIDISETTVTHSSNDGGLSSNLSENIEQAFSIKFE